MKKYEGMFLVDQEAANKRWDEVIGHIRTVLEKHKAEILDLEKWNDFKLAYPIKKRKKATYILSHFNLDEPNVAAIRDDFMLSETVIRHMILKDDGRRQFLFEDTPEAETGAAPRPAAEKVVEEAVAVEDIVEEVDEETEEELEK